MYKSTIVRPLNRSTHISRSKRQRESAAIETVRAGFQTIREAGARFSIFKSTLYDKIDLVLRRDAGQMKLLGRPRALTENEEYVLSSYCASYRTEDCRFIASIWKRHALRSRLLLTLNGASLLFYGNPDKKLIEYFIKRHKAALQFFLSNKKEHNLF